MEGEWKKYLNQVELEEVEAIKVNFSNPERYISNNETTATQFKRDQVEYSKRLKPYIELAMARKKSPEIRKFRYFHIRMLSKIWDILLGGLVFSLLIIVGFGLAK